MKSKTVLFIDGMFSVPEFWDQITEVLTKKGYKCLTPSLPFHKKGLNKKEQEDLANLGLLDFVDHIEKEKNKLCEIGEKHIIVGHSMGGWIAQKLAEKGLASRLILINSAPPKKVCCVASGAIVTFSDLLLKTPIIKSKTWKLSDEKVFYGMLNGMPNSTKYTILDDMVHESGRAIFDMFNALNPFGKMTNIDENKIKCPVYVMSGKKDVVVSPRISESIAFKYGAKFMSFNEGNHFMHADPRLSLNIAYEIINCIKS